MLINKKDTKGLVEEVLQYDSTKCLPGTRKQQLVQLIGDNRDEMNGMLRIVESFNKTINHKYAGTYFNQAGANYKAIKIYETELKNSNKSDARFRCDIIKYDVQKLCKGLMGSSK